MTRMLGGTVPFAVSREVAFDYLVDPAHRAQWQSSLARVEEVDGRPRVGQTWVDVTKPGVRARMCTTELRRPEAWSETGTWRAVSADLSLSFAERPDGCDVTFRFRVRVAGPVGLLATVLSLLPVRSDLRRASRLLDLRGGRHVR